MVKCMMQQMYMHDWLLMVIRLFTYEKARDATLKAHRSVFPFSFCDKDCMEEQLDAYYDCACADNKSFWGDDELNANTSVGVRSR